MSASAASWRAKAGSLASSSAWKRRFSSSRTSSGFIAATAACTGGPTTPFLFRTGRASRSPRPPGPAEVGAEDDAGAAIDQVGDRRPGLADAPVVGDATVLQRDVEVHAAGHPLPRDVDVPPRLLGPAAP